MPISEQIIIEARNTSKKVFNDIEKDARRAAGAVKSGFDDSTKAVAQQKSSFSELSLSLMGVEMIANNVFAALKMAWQFGKEGAQMERTIEKFDRLAESIGTTGDVLKNDLKVAVRGMVSDMELIESATKLLELGLAKSREEAVRLTRVAGALNMPMNQLVLTLTNMTTMRFDALGMSVDGFKERLKELEAQGMETNRAFKEAFLQQAEAQILKMGEAADSSAAKFVTLEVAAKNYFDFLKMEAASVTEKSGGFLGTLTKQLDLIVKIREAAEKGILTSKEAWIMEAKLYDKRVELDDITRDLLLKEAIMRDDRKESINVMKEAIKGNNDLASSTGDVARASETAREGMAGYVRMTREAGKASEESQSGLKNFLSVLDADVGSPIASFIEDLKWWLAGGGKINQAFDELKKGVEEGAITPEQAEQWAEELFKATQDLQVDLNMITADEAAENIQKTLGGSLETAKDYISGTEGIKGALYEISSTAWYIDLYYRYHGELPGAGLGRGGGGGEGGGGGGSRRYGGEVEGQQGLDFIVPAGYPNDSLPIWVSSGERVVVLTPQQQAEAKAEGGGRANYQYRRGGDVYVVNNYSRGAAAMSMAVLKSQRAKRINISMGA